LTLDEGRAIGLSAPMSDSADLKRAAAARALDFVSDGMRLGLGSGTTSEAFIELLAARVRGGLNVVGVPTSEHVGQLARTLGIALGKLDDIAPLDLTVDGADEADRDLNLIKGGGAALLREKIVASSSKKMLVIADGSKLVAKLGRFPLPVEVIEFGHATTAARISVAMAAIGYPRLPVTLRCIGGVPVKTDGGNMIYDCVFGVIADAAKLAAALSSVIGVVEHGLFVKIASTLVIASADGVQLIERTG
jgi:ribose 5-phosphate isomerase A